MAKVILHVGFHKTGTTAIQEFARKNYDTLRAAGIHYPAYPEWARTQSTAHYEFAHGIAGNSKVFDERSLRRVVDEWLAATRPGETLLISAEAMSRHLAPGPGAPWLERRREYVRNLAGFLSGHDAEVVAVLRRQDDFVRSLYFEHIGKRGRHGHLEFSEYRAKVHRSWMRFEDNLHIYSECFARVNVMIYEDLVQTGDLCGEFFRRVGVDPRGLEAIGVVRQSLNPVQAELKRVLNLNLKPSTDNGRVLSWVNSNEVKAILDRHYDVANASPWESVDVRRRYLQSFDAENDRIRDTYFPGRRDLFPELRPDGREGNVVRLGNGVFSDLLISALFRAAPPVRRGFLARLLARAVRDRK